MRPWGACLSVSVVALLGGCSSTVVGEAYPVDSIGMFDPCAVLSHDELLSLGVDPGTQRVDLLNTHIDGFNVCSWEGSWFYLGLTSADRSLDAVEKNSTIRDLRRDEIAGRSILVYQEQGDDGDLACNVAFATAQSTAMVRVGAKFSIDRPETPCALVERAAQTIVPLLS
ncbi:DUF3558 family protein [Rhodococcus sp. ACPA4]|uniref:DUF3558 family protein n=1 Tax=Rhodococcus sp. ACPA4 TaxID=2028571 RepID=UPI0026D7CAC3